MITNSSTYNNNDNFEFQKNAFKSREVTVVVLLLMPMFICIGSGPCWRENP